MLRGIAGILLLVLLGTAGCSSTPEPSGDPPLAGETTSVAPLEKQLPLTAANLRGHKALYDEGWFIVTSTRDALQYAYDHSVITSGEAIARVTGDLADRSAAYPDHIATGLRESASTLKAVHATGRRFSQAVTRGAEGAGHRQIASGLDQLSHSWAFVTGGIYLGHRTDEHWESLKGTWPVYYRNLKRDFSNLYQINQAIAERFRTDMEVHWDDAFDQAVIEFQDEYQRSSERPNSLLALGDILAGYLKAAYQGLVRPSARSLVVGASAGAENTSYVFTPVAGSILLTGRTLQATGLSVYYAGRTTIEVVSPTLESGFLTALGIVSLGSGAATRVGGETLGLANQVAFTGAALAAGTAEGAGRALGETGRFVALAAYDVGKGSMTVVINQAQSGVVLGYNALTAIPAHLLIGVPSAAIFLAYEGPRLVLVRASGKSPASGEDGTQALEASLEDLPAGTVVDLKALQAQPGAEVEVLTDDPAITTPVLQEMSKDLSHEKGP